MNNLLPIYKSPAQLSFQKQGNYNNWEHDFYLNESNNIPAFATEYAYCSAVPTISSIDVYFLDKKALKRGELTILETFSQSTSIFSVKSKTESAQIYYSVSNLGPYPILNITTGRGVYQINIQMSNGDIWYSDLFEFLGAPIATYSCSNADFDDETNLFTIDIERTDTDPTANAQNVFILSYYNSLDAQTVNTSSTLLNYNIGESNTLTFDLTGFMLPFDFFIWSGACSGDLEITLFQFESGEIFQSEGNYFIQTES